METFNSTSQKEIGCQSCGAKLLFAPGTENLSCEYCGAENEIEKNQVEIIENSFIETLQSLEKEESNLVEEILVNCDSCGAQTTFDPQIISDDCEFCGSPIVVKEGHPEKVLKPEYILPFKIQQKEAFEAFKKWINSLWFAPNDLKEYAKRAEKLSGIYLPYWTYDAQTYSRYTGQRGIDKTVRDKDGKTRTTTTWYSVSGHYSHFFDDVMVVASSSLPRKKMDALEPWDLQNLEGYNDKYLAGFKAEHYQIGLEKGFHEAKGKMDSELRSRIEDQIGGDRQRISTLTTMHSEISFKHLLLPVWISAYKYSEKTYQIVVNARTGEVQGERPWSVLKIALAVIVAIGLIGFFVSSQQR